MTREQLKSRVQGIGGASSLAIIVENLADSDDYTPLDATDIRLHGAFRSFWTMRVQMSAQLTRAVNAELAPEYTSNLQQLISEWA